MKKPIYTLFFFLVWGASVFSQTFQEAMPDSVIYLTPEEEAFMIDKETKSLFKFYPNATSLLDVATRQPFSFAFEQKISSAFSVSLLAGFPRTVTLQALTGQLWKGTHWRGGLELRYYYQMPGLIKKNKQANNLSGNYFGIKYERGITSSKDQANSEYFNFFNIVYGTQKRFLNRGFIDFSIRLGNTQSYRNHPLLANGKYWVRDNFYLSAGIKAGIALGKNYKMSEDLVCPIFKCYSNRKSAFKINLVRNWSFGRSDSYPGSNFEDAWYVSLSPNISYEFKIAKSPLSFDQDLDVNVFFSSARFATPGFGMSSYSLKYHAGFRYYHGMRNRIRKGKSGNNLSGFYSFARAKLEQASSGYTYYRFNDVLFSERIIQKELEAQVGIGYQKEVLERLYFDLGIATTKDIKLNLNRALDGFQLTSYIKVGLMF